MSTRKEWDWLRSVPLFANLRPPLLARLKKSGQISNFAEATHLIRQGETGTSVLILQEGTVSVTVQVSATAVEVAHLGPGTLLGEISLFCGIPHTADVIATSNVRALQIPRESFWETVKSDTEALRAIIKLLAERVQSRTVPLAYLSFAARALVEDRFDPTILANLRAREDEISHFTAVFESMAEYVTTRTQQLEAAVAERSQDLVREVARRQAAEEELRRQASVDPLTGANNRRRFLQLAERELKRSRRYRRPLSMLMFDIDHFKAINDKYGHSVGDEALKCTVATCEATLRDHDILARIGGEEFVVLLPECTVDMAERVAERLRQALAEANLSMPDARLGLTVSVGVADCTEQSLDDVLQQADRAMYAAKRAGRNRVARAQGKN